MAIVITLFTLANATFYYTLPLETFQETNAVAIVSWPSQWNNSMSINWQWQAFGVAVSENLGAVFYAWIVCLSCLGALNSIIFSTGRQTQAAGARHYLPAFLESDAGVVSQSSDIRVVPTGFFGRIWQARNRVQVQNIPVYVDSPSWEVILFLISGFQKLNGFECRHCFNICADRKLSWTS